MPFPLSRSWQTSNLRSGDALTSASGETMCLGDPQLSFILGANFQRSTARRASLPLPSRPPPSPKLEGWTTLPPTTTLHDLISQISRPSASYSSAAPALSVAARASCEPGTPAATLPPTPILQPISPRNDELHPRNKDIDESSSKEQINALDTFNHRMRVSASSEPAARLGANTPALKTDPHARSHATQHNCPPPAAPTRTKTAPPARSQDTLHNRPHPAAQNIRPPPVACWRFLEHKKQEDINSAAPGLVAKVIIRPRTSVRRASTAGEDYRQNVGAVSQLQELRGALAGVRWDTDVDALESQHRQHLRMDARPWGARPDHATAAAMRRRPSSSAHDVLVRRLDTWMDARDHARRNDASGVHAQGYLAQKKL
mmetsp:Transcript_3296/g.7503  ORF Transcript_3296/g.7503 Transcript_3296/m.7503 type:complete len:373 (+) Transcript_3296:45-1163(+)